MIYIVVHETAMTSIKSSGIFRVRLKLPENHSPDTLRIPPKAAPRAQNAVVESTSIVGTIDAMNLRKTTR